MGFSSGDWGGICRVSKCFWIHSENGLGFVSRCIVQNHNWMRKFFLDRIFKPREHQFKVLCFHSSTVRPKEYLSMDRYSTNSLNRRRMSWSSEKMSFPRTKPNLLLIWIELKICFINKNVLVPFAVEMFASI